MWSVLPVFPQEGVAVGQKWCVDRRINGIYDYEHRLPITYELVRVDPGPGRMGGDGEFLTHTSAQISYAGAVHSEYPWEGDPEERTVERDLSVEGLVLFDIDAGVMLQRREFWQERAYLSKDGVEVEQRASQRVRFQQSASRLILSPTGSALEAFFYPDGVPEAPPVPEELPKGRKRPRGRPMGVVRPETEPDKPGGEHQQSEEPADSAGESLDRLPGS
jgi:hypothetical protein